MQIIIHISIFSGSENRVKKILTTKKNKAKIKNTGTSLSIKNNIIKISKVEKLNKSKIK